MENIVITTDNCSEVRAMISYAQSKKELNARLEKKFQKLVKKRKGGKQRKCYNISDDEKEKSIFSLAESLESGVSSE